MHNMGVCEIILLAAIYLPTSLITLGKTMLLWHNMIIIIVMSFFLFCGPYPPIQELFLTLCQGSLLAGLREPYGVLGIKSRSGMCRDKHPTYYLFDSPSFIFLPLTLSAYHKWICIIVCICPLKQWLFGIPPHSDLKCSKSNVYCLLLLSLSYGESSLGICFAGLSLKRLETWVTWYDRATI